MGHSHARVHTPPLRELTPKTTLGFAFIAFAKMLGFRLFPWQKWLALHALELLPDGKPRFRTIVLLISRQNGKSTWAALLILFWLFVQDKRLVLGTAQSLAMAEEVFDSVVEIALADPELSPHVTKVLAVNGKKALKLTGGRRYLPIAATGSAARGFDPDGLFVDELREQHDWQAWSALESSQIAQKFAQLLAASNAGDVMALVLAHLRDSAMEDIRSAATDDTRLGLFDFSADPSRDIADREGFREGNPSLEYSIETKTLLSKLSSLPPEVFKTEHLCLWVESLDSPIDSNAWKAGADGTATLEAAAKAGRLHTALDISADQMHATLGGAALVDPDAPTPTYRVSVLRSWAGPDAAERAMAESPGLLAALAPQTFSWLPKGAGGVFETFVSEKLRGLAPREVSGSDVEAICQQLTEQVQARRVVHNDDPLLNAQVFGARRAYVGDGWRFARRLGSGGHVDALYAIGAALRQARLTPPPSFTLITAPPRR